MTLSITPVRTDADRKSFVELPFTLYARDPQWRPPLKNEVYDLIGGPAKNPWFLHARAEFFLARRHGRVVGRISAQVCELVQERRPGLGQWGLYETIDDAEVSAALIQTAEAWLREQGMTRAQGPISLSIWDEPGLLVSGFETAPRVMMGHHLPYYEKLVLDAGYDGVKDLHAWTVQVNQGFPELISRIVAMGEKKSEIRIREIDLSRFEEEASLILDILNEAWSDNWGFVPLTDAEVAHVGKKLKPLAYADLVRIAEVDGVPVAFMMTLPNLNEWTADLKGNLFPFGWAKLLWRLRKGRANWMRVPLMGVRKKYQGTRMASMLAFMMIEYIRRSAISNHGAVNAEIGWILDDNGPMVSIANAIDSHIEKTYRIYERSI